LNNKDETSLETVHWKELIYVVLYNDNGKPNVKQIEECALRAMATNMLQLVYTYLEEVSIDNKETISECLCI